MVIFDSFQIFKQILKTPKSSFVFVFALIGGLIAVTRLGVFASSVEVSGQAHVSATAGLLTKVDQVRQLAGAANFSFRQIQIQGVVTWISSDRNSLVIQDDSGAFKFDAGDGESALAPGQRVRLEGGLILGANRASWREFVLMQNDRSRRNQTNTIYLTKGRCPFRLEYYQPAGPMKLALHYTGPDIPRQPISGTVLFHLNDATNWEPGLSCNEYEGTWKSLPDLAKLIPVRTGVVPDFNVAADGRKTNFCLSFTGALAVSQAGDYTIDVEWQGGSRLVLVPPAPHVTALGRADFPLPRPAQPGRSLRAADEYRWTEVQGWVTAVRNAGQGCQFEINTQTGRMLVEVVDAGGLSELLPNSEIRVRGVCGSLYVPGGGSSERNLLTPSVREIDFVQLPTETRQRFPVRPIRDLSLFPAQPTNGMADLIRVQGMVREVDAGTAFVLEDDSGQCHVLDSQASPEVVGTAVEVLGKIQPNGTNVWLHRIISHPSDTKLGLAPRVLTSIEQIRMLKLNEFSNATVRIRAVVTSCANNFYSIHDGVYGISCKFMGFQQPLLQMGDYLEIEGLAHPGAFGPAIIQASYKPIGKALLPSPLHPDWEQLMNGSLDQQWVELEGVVRQVLQKKLILGIKGGEIEVRIDSGNLPEIASLQNALVQVTGVVWPLFNRSRQIQGAYLVVHSCEFVKVVESGTVDPFSMPLKRVPELLYFDPKGTSPFRRVRVAGQVVHDGNPVSYLMYGTNGLRFTLQSPAKIEPGDLVEIVGYPEVGGLVPVLRDAVARSTGHATLPAAQVSSLADLLSGRFDSTLVQVEAVLLNQTIRESEQVLECQLGRNVFVASLRAGRGQLPALAPGSRLGLKGVLVEHGRSSGLGREVESFSLQLNTAADVQVLARPPWWTVRHIALIAGTLLAGLLVAAVWIHLLRRQVEERTARLGREIRQRERAEQQRLMEVERSRIARDIHDELGAGLTQISLISSLTALNAKDFEHVRTQSDKVAGVSRSLTRTLDEIVWAVRPQNDNLESVLEYLGQTTRGLCEGSNVQCWFSAPAEVPAVDIPANSRHNFVLACREAVTNVLKHSGATELRMNLRLEADALVVEFLDNGCGFSPAASNPKRSGLRNMRERLAEIGGSCEITPISTGGMRVRFVMPFTREDSNRQPPPPPGSPPVLGDTQSSPLV